MRSSEREEQAIDEMMKSSLQNLGVVDGGISADLCNWMSQAGPFPVGPFSIFRGYACFSQARELLTFLFAANTKFQPTEKETVGGRR